MYPNSWLFWLFYADSFLFSLLSGSLYDYSLVSFTFSYLSSFFSSYYSSSSSSSSSLSMSIQSAEQFNNSTFPIIKLIHFLISYSSSFEVHLPFLSFLHLTTILLLRNSFNKYIIPPPFNNRSISLKCNLFCFLFANQLSIYYRILVF